MPFTIPVTAKQRASILTLNAQVDIATRAAQMYDAAIIEGCADAPATFSSVTLTDAGLELGDVATPAPETP